MFAKASRVATARTTVIAMPNPVEHPTTHCARKGWAVAYALTLSKHDADDVMQQAFVVALTNPDKVPDAPWPWFAGVIRNCARSKRREKNRMRAMDKLESFEMVGRTKSPFDLIACEEISATILKHLETLPDKEREAVCLCYMSGLSQPEAARIMGLRLNTVKSHVRRGLERLRSRMGQRKAAPEAYLASIAIPLPPGGWDAAVARWESLSAAPAYAWSAGILGSRFKSVGTVGVGAATVVGVILLLLWPILSGPDQGPSATDGPGGASNAISRVGAAPHSHPDFSERKALSVPGAEIATETEVDHSAAFPQAPANDEEAQSGAPEPLVETTRVVTREIAYASGSVQMRWQALLTEAGEVRHGTFTRHFADGTIQESGQYENGMRAGRWLEYHPNHGLAVSRTYDAGERAYMWTSWHANGHMSAQGRYEGGQRSGVWEYWHATGELQRRETFELGKRNGVASHYNEAGQLVRETTWLHGVKQGKERLFRPDGSVAEERTYQDGKPID